MIKTIKVKDVTFNREWTGPDNRKIYYFNVKYGSDYSDGEETAQFSTVNKNQTKFLIGNTYEVEELEKQNKNGSYLFVNYSKNESEKQKGNKGGSFSKGGSWVRSRKEVITIISQSSFEAAAELCIRIAPDKVSTHTEIAKIAKQLTTYVIEEAGLNSDDCKNNNKDALKLANDKGIILQKALKIAILCLNLPNMEKSLPENIIFRSTLGISTVAELIAKDITEIANGF